MWNILRNSFLIFLSISLFLACNRAPGDENNHNPKNTKVVEEQLVKANKQVALNEDSQINDLVNRYGWEMTKTGTGLRIQIYDSPGGKIIQKGSKVSMHYTIRLIDGTVVYNSRESGIKTFVVGKGEVIAGMEEAMLLLKNNDKARLVIPSFLGHGLSGDGDKITGKATLIYQLEIIYVD